MSRSVPQDILKLAARVATHVARSPIAKVSDIPEWLSEAGFQRVMHGASRAAVISDDWVIKFPLSATGMADLEGEFDVFMQYVGRPEIEYGPHTELIRQGRNLAMVQEAVIVDTKMFDANITEINKIAKALNMHDVHWGNFGFRRVGSGFQPISIDLGEHSGYQIGKNQKKGDEIAGIPESLHKFAPNEADSAFLEGMRKMGMDPAQFAKATHRKLG